jgi:hypothetical protein
LIEGLCGPQPISAAVGRNDRSADGDYLLYPSLTLAAGEGIDISAGAMLFEGPATAQAITLGGLFDHNDQAFMAISYAF